MTRMMTRTARMETSVLALLLCTLFSGVHGFGVVGKFRNLCGRTLNLYWRPEGSDKAPVRTGVLPGGGGETSFQTYVGHR